MTSDKFAIFYSKTTGRIRWMLVPDHESELVSLTGSNNPGEDFIILDKAKFRGITDLETMQQHITHVTGLTPKDDRYCIVDDDGTIHNHVIADPEGCGDVVEGFSMIKHPTADRYDRYDHAAKSFTVREA